MWTELLCVSQQSLVRALPTAGLVRVLSKGTRQNWKMLHRFPLHSALNNHLLSASYEWNSVENSKIHQHTEVFKRMRKCKCFHHICSMPGSCIICLGLEQLVNYHKDPKFSDRQVWANSVDPDQTAPLLLLEEQFDVGLHCLQFRRHPLW